jgi:hypothetical protein
MVVTTIDGLFQAVGKANEVLEARAAEAGVPSRPGSELWYRGTPRQEFKLVPSLFRVQTGPGVEAALYRDYVLHAANPGDWPALFAMQHHFIPTRLLDWSAAWAVALFFAFHTDRAIDQPTLWVLHPGLLNRLSLAHPAWRLAPASGVPSVEELTAVGLGYQAAYLGASGAAPTRPVAIAPGAIFPRLIAQRGRFTIHGSDRRGLEEQCGEAVERIVIDSGDRTVETMREFATTQADPLSIFPDQVGLAQWLRQRHDLDRVTRAGPLSHHLRTLWRHDAEILARNRDQATSAEVRTPGIENCRVQDAYVDRDDNAADRLAAWLTHAAEGGVRVIAGDAGSGKTNFLVNLLVTRAIYDQQAVMWFPLFRFEPEDSLLENLSRQMKGVLGQDDADLNVAISELLARRDTVLVLDGLDELSRTKGSGAAIRVMRLIERLLGEPTRTPRILVTCRDDILNNLNRAGALTRVLGPAGGPQILLKPLSADELGAHRRITSLAPGIGALLGRYPIFLRLPTIHPKATTSSGLFGSAFATHKRDGRTRLRLLGQLAQTMLERRQDFVDAKTFELLPKARALLGPAPLRPLIQERGSGDQPGDIRFFHHTIREFVLGWNVHACLTGKPPVWNLLRETSDLDYEGAEIFRVVHELGDIPDWAAVRRRSEHQPTADRVRYNNYAWNCFEAAGMLGVTGAQRRIVLDWIHDVLAGPVDGRDGRHAFKTKYNAARCLERLHCGSPPHHWRFVGDYYRQSVTDPACRRIYACAVRGFQRRHLSPGNRPPIVMRAPWPTDPLQGRFSTLLIRKIAELHEFTELSQDALYLQINLTHALIRWYQPTAGDTQQLLRLADNPSRLDSHVRENLDLTLALWAGLRQDRVEVANDAISVVIRQRRPVQPRPSTIDG